MMMAFLAVFGIVVVVVGLAAAMVAFCAFASGARRGITVVVFDQTATAALAAVDVVVTIFASGPMTTAGLGFDAASVVVVIVLVVACGAVTAARA
jgi:hypothetical protein